MAVITRRKALAAAAIALQNAGHRVKNLAVQARATAAIARKFGIGETASRFAASLTIRRKIGELWSDAKGLFPKYSGRLEPLPVLSDVTGGANKAHNEYPSICSSYFPATRERMAVLRGAIERCLGPHRTAYFSYSQPFTSIGEGRTLRGGNTYYGKITVPRHWNPLYRIAHETVADETLRAADGNSVSARVHTLAGKAGSDTLVVFVPGLGSGYRTPVISREVALAALLGIHAVILDVVERGKGGAHFVNPKTKATFFAEKLGPLLQQAKGGGIRKVVFATHSLGSAYASMVSELLRGTGGLRGLEVFTIAQAPVPSKEEHETRLALRGIRLSSPAAGHFAIGNRRSLIVHFASDPLLPSKAITAMHAGTDGGNIRLVPASHSPYASTLDERDAARFAEAMRLQRREGRAPVPLGEMMGHNGGSVNQLREVLWLFGNYLMEVASRKKTRAWRRRA